MSTRLLEPHHETRTVITPLLTMQPMINRLLVQDMLETHMQRASEALKMFNAHYQAHADVQPWLMSAHCHLRSLLLAILRSVMPAWAAAHGSHSGGSARQDAFGGMCTAFAVAWTMRSQQRSIAAQHELESLAAAVHSALQDAGFRSLPAADQLWHVCVDAVTLSWVPWDSVAQVQMNAIPSDGAHTHSSRLDAAVPALMLPLGSTMRHAWLSRALAHAGSHAMLLSSSFSESKRLRWAADCLAAKEPSARMRSVRVAVCAHMPASHVQVQSCC